MVRIYEILEGMHMDQEDYVKDMFTYAVVFDIINDMYILTQQETNDFSGEPEDWYHPYEIPNKIHSIVAFTNILDSKYPNNRIMSKMCEYLLNYLSGNG